MRVLGDFVERYAAHKARSAELGKMSRIGMIATAGDRRDDDMRELGAIAADHFDVLVVREDARLRGRKSGETSGLIAEGARARMAEGGARCRQVEIVLDETVPSGMSWHGPIRATSSRSASTPMPRSCPVSRP